MWRSHFGQCMVDAMDFSDRAHYFEDRQEERLKFKGSCLKYIWHTFFMHQKMAK